MTTEKIKNAYNKYGLTRDDVYKHENIKLDYEIVKCEKDFCVMKAIAIKGKEIIQTFGSALKGEGFKDGNTMSWYVVEMAEKRAMSRAVLKMTGLYELGVFGEDESEEFKRK